MPTRKRKNHIPPIYKKLNLRRWLSFFIVCTRGDIGPDCLSVHFTLTFAIPPDFDEINNELKILVDALKREDGEPLERVFSGFGFEGFFVRFDTRADTGMGLDNEILRYFTRERWGLVTDLSWEAFGEGGKQLNQLKLRYWILPSPYALTPILHVFNALTFANPTHLFRFHEMWGRLHEIQSCALEVSDPDEITAEQFFVARERVSRKLDRPAKTRHFTRMVNRFLARFTQPRKDYLGFRRELEDWHLYSRDYRNAIEGFLGRILSEIITEYESAHLVSKCRHCGNIFPFVKSKRYCSGTNKSDCGRSARNRRAYLRRKNPAPIRPLLK